VRYHNAINNSTDIINDNGNANGNGNKKHFDKNNDHNDKNYNDNVHNNNYAYTYDIRTTSRTIPIMTKKMITTPTNPRTSTTHQK